MNEIIWLDVDGFPYTVSDTGNILGIKDRTYRCFLRTPMAVGSRGNDRISLYYLTKGYAINSELSYEYDTSDDNNFD